MRHLTTIRRLLDAMATATAVFFGLTPDPTRVTVVDDSYQQPA